MQKFWIIGTALVALSACNANPPVSNSGPGFTNYSSVQMTEAERQQALSGPSVQATSLSGGGNISSEELQAAGITTPTNWTPSGNATQQTSYGRSSGIEASPTNAAPTVVASHSGISDEQSFEAVSERETIASDAARRAEQAAQYTVIQPTALPGRQNTGPNIVAYALSAPNVKGQEWYSRFMLSGQSRYRRNCAKYNNPDEAQRDFLSRGGPESDRLGIDPDGDGFACGWDPAPFIVAARSAAGN